MDLYLMPSPNGESNIVPESLQKIGIKYLEVESLYEMWPAMCTEQTLVVRVPDNAMTVLVRHMSTLLGVTPTRVDSAPGSSYTYEWNTATANLHSEVWENLEGKFAKSGFGGSTPTHIEERSALTPQGHATDTTIDTKRARRAANGVKNSAVAGSSIQLDKLDDEVDLDTLLDQ